MRIILVGAPNSGKEDLAIELADLLSIDKLTFRRIKEGHTMILDEPLAYGLDADYRTETLVAIERTFDMQRKDSCVFTHSLIDSVAYSALRLQRMLDWGGVRDETLMTWACTAQQNGNLLRDSFRHDFVFFLTKDYDTKKEKEQIILQESLEEVMDAFEIPFIELHNIQGDDFLDIAKDCAKMVQTPGQKGNG